VKHPVCTEVADPLTLFKEIPAFSKAYLLFPTVPTLGTHSNPLDGDPLGTSIRTHPPRSVRTQLERRLDALERSTFSDSNCRAG